MIIVAGSINLDLIARVPRLPRPGETLTGLDFAMTPGGKGANQALAARRAGADVTMVGAVGNDANAAQALALLETERVNIDPVVQLSDTPTGVALILVDNATGENEIVVVPGANGALDDRLVSYLTDSAEALLLQMEIPTAANRALLERAQRSGIVSYLNIAPYNDDALQLALLADYTIANETEFDLLAQAMALAGGDETERAVSFSARTGKAIVVTLGPQGAFAVKDSTLYRAASPTIVPVDTVGAGDTFCGYLAVGLSEGMALEAALSLACRAGALTCLQHGAQPAIAVRAAVDAFKA